jgi:hypothetical protein
VRSAVKSLQQRSLDHRGALRLSQFPREEAYGGGVGRDFSEDVRCFSSSQFGDSRVSIKGSGNGSSLFARTGIDWTLGSLKRGIWMSRKRKNSEQGIAGGHLTTAC